MKLNIFTSSVLVFQVYIAFALENDFVIYRNRSSTNQTSKTGRDSFKIPTSICNQTVQGDKCGPFGAAIDGVQNCSCSCPSDSATFLFYGNEWTCLDNNIVRNLQECSNTYYFLTEVSRPQGTELLALNVGDVTPIDISRYDYAGQYCEVYLNTSWYLGCNGTRLGLSQYLKRMSELFIFTTVSTSSIRHFALQVKHDIDNTHLLQGRIINLGVLCTMPNPRGLQYQYGCLMFKLTGQLTCRLPVHNAQESSTIKPQESNLTGTPTQTTLSATSTQSTTVFPSNGSDRPSSSRERSSSSLNLIAGITASILPLVIIVGLILYRRCYSNKNSDAIHASTREEHAQDTVTMSTLNSTIQDDDDESVYNVLSIRATEPHLYVSNYCVPYRPAEKDDYSSGHLHASRNIPGGHNTQNNGEPFYDVLEQSASDTKIPSQNGSDRLEHPVYHILEAPTTVEGHERPANYGTRPVYNILMEPHLEEAEGPGHLCAISSRGQFPVEGFNHFKHPVYHILEAPTTSEGHERPAYYGTRPMDHILDEPHLEDAEGPGHYCSIPSGRQFPVEGSNRLKHPVYHILEAPTIAEGHRGPANYGTGPVCHILEELNLDDENSPGRYCATSSGGQFSVAGLKEPVNHVTEPVSHVTESVSHVTESVNRVTESVNRVTEPVNCVTEPVNHVTESVNHVTEPVNCVTEPVCHVTESIGHVTAPMYNVLEIIIIVLIIIRIFKQDNPSVQGALLSTGLLEETYLENLDGSGHYDTISTEGPLCNTSEEPFPDDPCETNYDFECISNPLYNVADQVIFPSTSAVDK